MSITEVFGSLFILGFVIALAAWDKKARAEKEDK